MLEGFRFGRGLDACSRRHPIVSAILSSGHEIVQSYSNRVANHRS